MLIVNKHSNDGQMRLTDRRHDADGAAQDPAAGRGPRQGLWVRVLTLLIEILSIN